MTRNPMVTRDTTSATEALQLMVQRHFRHLVSHIAAFVLRISRVILAGLQ